MQKLKQVLLTALLLAGIASPVLVPIAAYAHDLQGGDEHGPPTTSVNDTVDSNTTSDNSTSNTAESSSDSDSSSSGSSSSGKQKLAETKLNVCKKHETVVNGILSRIVTRGTRQIEVFNKISTRVQDFYKASGNTVANYDQLVKAVDDAKSKAQADLDAMKTSQVAFKCDGTDPKGVAGSFKSSLKLAITDLKAYKTSIKNLIVAVKSANSTAENKTTTTNTQTTNTTTSNSTETGEQ